MTCHLDLLGAVWLAGRQIIGRITQLTTRHIRIGARLYITDHNTRNTSPPKSVNDSSMKNTKINRNFYSVDSVWSSVLFELGLL